MIERLLHRCLTPLLLLCLGCAGQGAELQKLLRHFEKSGVRGRYASQPTSLGAIQAGRFFGDNFSVDIYQFRDEAAAQAAQKTAFNGQPCTRNGCFLLVAQRGEGYVLPAFQQFR